MRQQGPIAKGNTYWLCDSLDELAGIVAESAIDRRHLTSFDFAVEVDDTEGDLEDVNNNAAGWYGIREANFFDNDGKVILVGYYGGEHAPSCLSVDEDDGLDKIKAQIIEAIRFQYVCAAEDMVGGPYLLVKKN